MATVAVPPACGSHRLDTAVERISQGGASGSGGVPNGGLGDAAGLGGNSLPEGGAGSLGPIQPVELIGLEDFGASYTVGPLNAERFQVDGQTFKEAWRATMSEPPSSPWIAQLVVPLNKPVKAGQLVHVTFWLNCERAGAHGDCYTEYIFERAFAPWEKSVTFAARGGSGWSKKDEYFRVIDTYDAGEAQMVFRLGYETQVIALGGLILESIGDSP